MESLAITYKNIFKKLLRFFKNMLVINVIGEKYIVEMNICNVHHICIYN